MDLHLGGFKWGVGMGCVSLCLLGVGAGGAAWWGWVRGEAGLRLAVGGGWLSFAIAAVASGYKDGAERSATVWGERRTKRQSPLLVGSAPRLRCSAATWPNRILSINTVDCRWIETLCCR